MQNAVVLAVTFERPAHFDLAAHWKSSTAQLQQKRGQFPTTLALAPDAAVSLRRWCRVSAAPEVRCLPELPEKWSVLHVAFENDQEARFVTLGLGARVLVLAPDSLRDQVSDEMRAAMNRPAVTVS
jgi:predicted DNA-binding transcriptional regulator YafY